MSTPLKLLALALGLFVVACGPPTRERTGDGGTSKPRLLEKIPADEGAIIGTFTSQAVAAFDDDIGQGADAAAWTALWPLVAGFSPRIALRTGTVDVPACRPRIRARIPRLALVALPGLLARARLLLLLRAPACFVTGPVGKLLRRGLGGLRLLLGGRGRRFLGANSERRGREQQQCGDQVGVHGG